MRGAYGAETIVAALCAAAANSQPATNSTTDDLKLRPGWVRRTA